MTVQEVVSKAKKIVVKIGSNTLAKADGKINIDFIYTFIYNLYELNKSNEKKSKLSFHNHGNLRFIIDTVS